MDVLRYAAFTDDPAGGNPAGVVLDASGMSDEEMLAVAADVGYSETAFLSGGPSEFDVRYFSPVAEVAFCGHATIAATVALGRSGGVVFHTRGGDVPVKADGGRATLTSLEPAVAELGDGDLAELLAALRWPAHDLDAALPPRVAFAGVYHPVIAVLTRE